MAGYSFQSLLKIGLLAFAMPTTIYLGMLGLLISLPTLQTHLFYLHRVTLTRFDLNVPEMFGFLPNQVTPFYIETADAERLHAWHVLPLGIYRRKQNEVLAGTSVGEGAEHVSARETSLQLLRDDPDARLVIYFHGTSGTIASGFRPDSYRALQSTSPDKIHILTIEYRGYGLSSGTPSEEGLLRDAIAAVDWAMGVAGIPASRIVVFGQSLGTAVAISLTRHLASQSPPIQFAGLVLVASFTDVATLTGTYRIGGVIPVLSPLTVVPRLFAFFTGFLHSTWLSKDRIAELVRYEGKKDVRYHITMIHSEDDSDIPFSHTQELYWHAVNASTSTGLGREELEEQKLLEKEDLGSGGWAYEWRTDRGVLREEILKYGSHDKLMSYPVTALAVLRAFKAADPMFEA